MNKLLVISAIILFGALNVNAVKADTLRYDSGEESSMPPEMPGMEYSDPAMEGKSY